MYQVKELFLTLQGEGCRTGSASIFCRFSGCNLWSGLEEHRAQARCNFCDTDFVGVDGVNGGRYTDDGLVGKIVDLWPVDGDGGEVFTGGEPSLQLDGRLLGRLQDAGFRSAIETNGTRELPGGLDWVCMSPKTEDIVVTSGDELKFVYPQRVLSPEDFVDMDFEHFFLQPLSDGEDHVGEVMDYIYAHPQWRMSLQTHKYLGIP